MICLRLSINLWSCHHKCTLAASVDQHQPSPATVFVCAGCCLPSVDTTLCEQRQRTMIWSLRRATAGRCAGRHSQRRPHGMSHRFLPHVATVVCCATLCLRLYTRCQEGGWGFRDTFVRVVPAEGKVRLLSVGSVCVTLPLWPSDRCNHAAKNTEGGFEGGNQVQRP